MNDERTRTARRDFLRAVAVGTAAATTVGCASAPPQGMSRAAIDARLTHLDEALLGLEDVGFVSAAIRQGRLPDPGDDEYVRAADAFARRALRALTIAGHAHDLDVDTRRSPEFHDAMARYADELDDAFGQTALLLGDIDDDVEAELRTLVSSDFDLASQLGETLDRRSASAGVGGMARGKLRVLSSEVKRGLRAQPPRTYVADVLGKADHLLVSASRDQAIVRVRADAFTRRILMRVQDDPFGPAVGPTPTPTFQPVQPTPRGMRRAEHVLIAGGIMAGAGGLLFGIGLGGAFLGTGAGSVAMAVVATVGGLLILVGLLTLLAGAVRRARLRSSQRAYSYSYP